MKVNMLFAALTLSTFFAHAQSSDSTTAISTPTSSSSISKGDKVVAVGTNLFNNTFIQYRSYYSDRGAIRIGLSGKYNNLHADNNAVYPAKFSSTQSALGISIGFQNSIVKYGKLETYAGIDFLAGYDAYSMKETSPSFTSGGYDYTNVLVQRESFATAQIQPIIGANVYIYKGLSVGFEYRMAFANYRRQIGYHYDLHTEDADGNVISDPDEDNKLPSVNNVSVGLSGTAFLTVGLKLN